MLKPSSDERTELYYVQTRAACRIDSISRLKTLFRCACRGVTCLEAAFDHRAIHGRQPVSQEFAVVATPCSIHRHDYLEFLRRMRQWHQGDKLGGDSLVDRL